MLEMLNPSALDIARFAASTLSFRFKFNRMLSRDLIQARTLLVERFCAPPEAARRTPNLARLKDDSKRYFGWKQSEWAQHEASVSALLSSADTRRISHLSNEVCLYKWRPKQSSPRGRLLLCHGWEGYALNFALLIQLALDSGWEVHAFDHLAHGASTGTKSGLPIVLSTLQAVAAELGTFDALVAHSLGAGAAAWATAHNAVDAKRVVLIAPFFNTYTLTAMWCKAHLLDNDARDLLQQGLEADSNNMTFADFMPENLAHRISRPTFVIHDRKDRMTAFKHSFALAEQSRHVTLHEAKGLGHVAVLADNACAHAVLRFCNG
jgi:pimeloyl-ACP methyl ester carboxylesterase